MTEPRERIRNRARTRALLVLPAAALAGLLAACGDGDGDSGAGSGTTTPPPAAATRVTTDLADFKITLSQQNFTPGTYAFVMTNSGQHDHALEIEGPGGENRSDTVAPGESTTLTVTLKDGTYEIYCPVDGHKDLGMKTEITVAGAPVNTPTTPSNPSTPGNGY
ncbi:copper-binding protein [Streptomyces sp. SKN60]|uniref:plastocyanin/azurin family copper-binding protein n=1 Tax=Streptomyces sp. SKN60 TaxID=2855506 RepID=UPI0022482E0B|nr:plastocyanin/azurin family copper-binding protein [Streptomyces sp. SKN60]MCX2179507.1 copper-binding protein [Streptomyces sp. SKN60]